MRKTLGIWALIVCVPLSLAARPTHKAPRKLIGVASYYGHEHHGRRMANGRRFDEHKLTAAAHPALPLGSRVRVTNLRNQKSVVVTITDRMPKSNKRIIDLSTAAAHALGLIGRGIGRVSVEKIR